MAQYKDRVLINVIVVQEPYPKQINSDAGKPSTKEEFTGFAVDCLGSDVGFWAFDSPWLKTT